MTQLSETDAAPAAADRSPGRARRSVTRSPYLGIATIVVLAAVAATLPLWDVDSYTTSVVYTVAFYATIAQAWNLMSGFTGYISFAHGALVGVGIYAGIIAMNAGTGLPLAVLSGGVAAMLASLLIGLPSLRLRGIAFAFATIFFQAAMLIVVQKSTPVTGGAEGLAMREIQVLDDLLVAMVALAGAATLAVFLLRRSRLGLRLLSIREDETAARTIGVRTVRLKLGAFAFSALFAGAAGAVHAGFLATVFPQNVFNLQSSLEPLVLALIGGPSSAAGPVAMAGVYGLSQEALQSLGSELHLALLGAILVLVVLFARNGLAGLVTSWRERRRRDGTRQ